MNLCNMPDLKTLNIKRDSLKSQVTLFTNWLDKLDLSNITDVILKNIQERLYKIEQIFDNYNEIQAEIELI